MITDSNQACLAKMTGRRLQEERVKKGRAVSAPAFLPQCHKILQRKFGRCQGAGIQMEINLLQIHLEGDGVIACKASIAERFSILS